MDLLTTSLLFAPPAFALGCAAAAIRARNLDRWLLPYLQQQLSPRRRAPGQPVHVLLAIADHFEPHNGEVSDARARSRVDRWVQEYPKLFGRFRDSDGQPPRHTVSRVGEYQPVVIDLPSPFCLAQRPPPQIQV